MVEPRFLGPRPTPNYSTMVSFCRYQKGFYLPDAISKLFVQQLFNSVKIAVSATNMTPMSPDTAKNPMINGTIMYKMLK